jgi:hypothetical protein
MRERCEFYFKQMEELCSITWKPCYKTPTCGFVDETECGVPEEMVETSNDTR